MTRPPPDDRHAESVADTRRRIRSTTWLAAGAATAASALFGILFAQPDPAPAAADPDLSSVTLPSFTTPSSAPSVPAPRTSTARHPHRVTASAPKPLQPPAQPPRRATKPGRTTSGAS